MPELSSNLCGSAPRAGRSEEKHTEDDGKCSDEAVEVAPGQGGVLRVALDVGGVLIEKDRHVAAEGEDTVFDAANVQWVEGEEDRGSWVD
jgi:hypothetical protein